MEDLQTQLKPGVKVKVTQQIPARSHAWSTEVTGTVLSYQQAKTGSWFAHAKNDRLWLDRLVLRKDDGEISTLNLDQYTRIDVVAES